MNKNLLSENMLRFGTKNLSEGSKRNLVLESVMQTIKEHGLDDHVYQRLLEFNPMTAAKDYMDREVAKATAQAELSKVGVYDYATNGIIATGAATCKLYNAAFPVPNTKKTVQIYQISVPVINLRASEKTGGSFKPVTKTYYYPAGNIVPSQSSTPAGAGSSTFYFAYVYPTADVAADDSQESLAIKWSGNGSVAKAINAVPGALVGYTGKKAQANNSDYKSTFKSFETGYVGKVTIK